MSKTIVPGIPDSIAVGTLGPVFHASCVRGQVNVMGGDRKGLLSCATYGKHDINAPFLWEGPPFCSSVLPIPE